MSSSKIRVALVGADTLLGREIKDVLEAARGIEIESFAANGEANFGEEEGEAVFRNALSSGAIEGIQGLILAGSEDGSAKALEMARVEPGSVKLIDCMGHLEHEADARIFAPVLEKTPPHTWIVEMAHPAAAALALILSKLSEIQPMSRAVIEIFEPASERGRAGMSELQQQTTSLLSFKQLEKNVYDTQVSFTMLPVYGESSTTALEAIEHRIETHLATLLGRSAQQGVTIPMPSLRLIQAPVFHGYTFSAWIEFEGHADAAKVEQALASDVIDVRSAEHEPPTNVGIAGQSGLGVGNIRVDRNNPKALWLWAVADNLRLVADGVAGIVKGLEQ